MTTVNSTTEQPNRVADAARLLEKFCAGTDFIMTYGDGEDDNDIADNRAALIAVQLLAIATQLERIADALENRS